MPIAQQCAKLGPHDGVLLACPQNCFMESRRLRADEAPHYPIPAHAMCDAGDASFLCPNTSAGWIEGGSLSVGGSASIIEPMNAWMALAVDHGAPLFSSLDWHPEDHCSFCQLEDTCSATSAAAGDIAPGSNCIRSRFSDATSRFNESHRCMDPISVSDYETSAPYYQWPRHCVAGTFGGRLDPYLDARLLGNATVVKLGTDRRLDSFSAFDGGRLSTAGAGAHDQTAGSEEALQPLDSVDDLSHALQAAGVSRLFVMGLATDFVVGNTALDALGSNPRTGLYDAPPSLVNGTVVLVAAASRAVIADGPTLDAVRAAGGAVVGDEFVAPQAALDELCRNTCDTQADCPTGDDYCEFGNNGHPWGDCEACAHGLGCSDRGTCTDAGVCECDEGYLGATCAEHQVGTQPGFVVPLIIALGSAAALALAAAGVLLARFLVRQYYRGRRAEDAQLEAMLTRIDTALQARAAARGRSLHVRPHREEPRLPARELRARAAPSLMRACRAVQNSVTCRFTVSFIRLDRFKQHGRMLAHETVATARPGTAPTSG